MNKDEIIAKKGLEYYKEYLRKNKEALKKRYWKKRNEVLAKRTVDSVEVKMWLCYDQEQPINERLAEQDRLASRIQKRLNYWWSKQTDRPHIIVCEFGHINKESGEVRLWIQLNQLRMTRDIVDNFKKAAPSVVMEVINEYAENQ